MKNLFNSNVHLWFLGLTFFASFYTQAFIGGTHGFYIPNNVVVGSLAVLFIGLAVLKALASKTVYFTQFHLYLLIGLLAIFVVGMVKGYENSMAVYQTLLAFIVVGFFAVALTQFEYTKRQLFILALLLIIAGLMNAIIALIQLYDSANVLYFFSGYGNFQFLEGVVTGALQQTNILAVFLSFSIALSLYLFFLLPKEHARFLSIFLFVSVMLMGYVLFVSGSRAGLLSLIISSLLILVSCFEEIRMKKRQIGYWLLAISIAVLTAIFLSNYLNADVKGVETVVNKTADIYSGESKRLYLYLNSWNLYLESPWLGYGIGNYQHVFAEYIISNNVHILEKENYTHPHNELLFWMLQSGIVVILVVLFWVYAFSKAVFSEGLKKGLLFLGLVSPFLIHAMLSYPFILSAFNLFVLISGLSLSISHSKTAYRFEISSVMQKISSGFITVVALGVLFAGWHTLASLKEIEWFDRKAFYTLLQTEEEKKETVYFTHASQNPLFKESVEMSMQKLANTALQTNDEYEMIQYLFWFSKNKHREMQLESYVLMFAIYNRFNDCPRVEEVLSLIKSKFNEEQKLIHKLESSRCFQQ